MVRLPLMFRYGWVLVLFSATLGCGSEGQPVASDVPDVSEGAGVQSTDIQSTDIQRAIAPPSPNQPIPQSQPKQQLALTLAPGRYCYSLDDGILTTHLRLNLDAQNQVQGDARSTLQNEDAAYYTTYAQKFSGSLTTDQAAVNMTTWIEDDVQETNETWTLTETTLQLKNNQLRLTDCQLVDPIFQDQSGLEAGDLLDGATTVHTERVEFAPGKSAATVSNSVVRGDRDVYVIGARGGQQMQLSIKALEDNAVFDLVSPNGYILTREALDETLLLPHTGDYQVIVGGTRGNATYEMTLRIQ